MNGFLGEIFERKKGFSFLECKMTSLILLNSATASWTSLLGLARWTIPQTLSELWTGLLMAVPKHRTTRARKVLDPDL